jgi:hypothetical protein
VTTDVGSLSPVREAATSDHAWRRAMLDAEVARAQTGPGAASAAASTGVEAALGTVRAAARAEPLVRCGVIV